MAMRSEVEKLTVLELYDWVLGKLEDEVDEDTVKVLEKNKVNGKSFVDLSESDLKEMFPLLGERKAITRLIDGLKAKPQLVSLQI